MLAMKPVVEYLLTVNAPFLFRIIQDPFCGNANGHSPEHRR